MTGGGHPPCLLRPKRATLSGPRFSEHLMVHGRSRTDQAEGLNAELPPRGEKSERLCPFVRDARWVSTISKATASRTASPQTPVLPRSTPLPAISTLRACPLTLRPAPTPRPLVFIADLVSTWSLPSRIAEVFGARCHGAVGTMDVGSVLVIALSRKSPGVLRDRTRGGPTGRK